MLTEGLAIKLQQSLMNRFAPQSFDAFAMQGGAVRSGLWKRLLCDCSDRGL